MKEFKEQQAAAREGRRERAATVTTRVESPHRFVRASSTTRDARAAIRIDIVSSWNHHLSRARTVRSRGTRHAARRAAASADDENRCPPLATLATARDRTASPRRRARFAHRDAAPSSEGGGGGRGASSSPRDLTDLTVLLLSPRPTHRTRSPAAVSRSPPAVSRARLLPSGRWCRRARCAARSHRLRSSFRVDDARARFASSSPSSSPSSPPRRTHAATHLEHPGNQGADQAGGLARGVAPAADPQAHGRGQVLPAGESSSSSRASSVLSLVLLLESSPRASSIISLVLSFFLLLESTSRAYSVLFPFLLLESSPRASSALSFFLF